MSDSRTTTPDGSGPAAGAADFLEWLGQRAEPFADGPALAAGAAALAERNLGRAGGQRLLDSVACRRGCAHCCHLPVLTTVPEAERALEAARRRLVPERLAGVAARAAAAAALSGAGPPAPATHPPCPFLEDDACLVHEARPLACRGWNSTDVEACRRVRDTADAAAVPVNARLRGVYANVGESLARALLQRGRAGPVYLVPALARLLDRGPG